MGDQLGTACSSMNLWPYIRLSKGLCNSVFFVSCMLLYLVTDDFSKIFLEMFLFPCYERSFFFILYILLGNTSCVLFFFFIHLCILVVSTMLSVSLATQFSSVPFLASLYLWLMFVFYLLFSSIFLLNTSCPGFIMSRFWPILIFFHFFFFCLFQFL